MNPLRYSSRILRQTILLNNPVQNLSRRVFVPRVTKVTHKSDSKPPPVPPVFSINDDHEDVFWEGKRGDFSEELKSVKKPFKEQKGTALTKHQNMPNFIKTEQSHKDFRKLMINMAVKKKRQQMNKVILEGKRLINDSIDAGTRIDTIYFSSDAHISEIHDLDRIVQEGTKLVKVLYKDMKLFSSLMTSPGWLAVAEKPDYDSIVERYQSDMPISLICDNIRDPGNLGTLVRSSAASNIANLIATAGCCDVWNDKTIKASCGAHFRLPIIDRIDWSSIKTELPPLEDTEFYILDSNLKSESKSYFQMAPFADDKAKNKVLIVSNEAHGPSSECEQFLSQISPSRCNRIHIPLGSSVESLNSAVAASLILFEFRKQFFLKISQTN